MTVHLLVSFSSLLVEDQNLFTFDVLNHLGTYTCAADCRSTDSDFTILIFQHHGVKRNFRTLFVFQAVDEDLLIFLYLELLSCYFYYCVHCYFVFLLLFSLKQTGCKISKKIHSDKTIRKKNCFSYFSPTQNTLIKN